MDINVRYWTENDSPKNGRKNNGSAVMVHSTATPGVMAASWYDRWNKSGIGKSVHAFVDNQSVWQYMPWDVRAAHCGGKGNDTCLSLEICEPKTRDEAYFAAAWENAADLTAHLCGLNGLDEKAVLSHAEGYRAGIASNHGDADIFFKAYGRTMDDFRAAVKAKLTAGEQPVMGERDNIPAPWALSAVQKAVAAGILLGDERGDLKLHAPITREALMVIFDRLKLL